MFSEKELHLEETDLRARIRNLNETQKARYLAMEQPLLKDPARYLRLNWLFLAGAHHFYLQRWFRGLLNLTLSLSGLFFLLVLGEGYYGALLLVSTAIIDIPQLLNARHIVHSYNNRVIARCLQQVSSEAGDL
ncbi:MAG: hypothetical protein RQ757_09030 [Pseudomonadales bacterium]|nr:hypothetical protein [Pseudomonadales bacterium]